MDCNLIPDSLLGMLWAQFAMAVSENRQDQKCPNCGEWFLLGPGGAKRSREFCSDSCKIKEYRGRRMKAVELARIGTPLEEIAKELRTNAETAKRWILAGENPERQDP